MWSGNEVITFRYSSCCREMSFVLYLLCFAVVLSADDVFVPWLFVTVAWRRRCREKLQLFADFFLFFSFAAERSANEVSLLSPQPTALLPARMCNSASKKWKKLFVWTSPDSTRFAFLSRSATLFMFVWTSHNRCACVHPGKDQQGFPRHLVTFYAVIFFVN